MPAPTRDDHDVPADDAAGADESGASRAEAPGASDADFVAGFDAVSRPDPPMARAAELGRELGRIEETARELADVASSDTDVTRLAEATRAIEDLASAKDREKPPPGRDAPAAATRAFDDVDWTPPDRGGDAPDGGASDRSLGENELPDFAVTSRAKPVKPAAASATNETPEPPPAASTPVARADAEPSKLDVDDLDRALAKGIDDLLDADAASVQEVLQDIESEADQVEAARPDEPPSAAAPAPDAPETETVESYESFEAVDALTEEEVSVTMPETPAEATTTETEAPAGSSSESAASEAARPTLGRRLLNLVVSALCAMNFPLRFVPRRLRLVVDLVALTLIFWVPIVWAIAVFVIGR